MDSGMSSVKRLLGNKFWMRIVLLGSLAALLGSFLLYVLAQHWFLGLQSSPPDYMRYFPSNWSEGTIVSLFTWLYGIIFALSLLGLLLYAFHLFLEKDNFKWLFLVFYCFLCGWFLFTISFFSMVMEMTPN